MTVSSLAFYVYTLAWPNGTVFYVGKGATRKDGTRRRPYDHIYLARHGEKSHKASIIRKIINAGEQIVVDFVFETNSEAEALQKEIELITVYPSLTNITQGGEGTSGYRHTPETIENITSKTRGKKRSEAFRQAVSARRKGTSLPSPSQESRDKKSRALKGIIRSEETCQKLRGENNPIAKLTEDDVRTIRARRANGELLDTIAKDYNVSYTTIQKVCSGITWKHVQ